MNIRTRLTFQFVLLVSVLLVAAFVSIYFFSNQFRRDEFFVRLQNKGSNIIQLLIQVDEVNKELLAKIDQNNPVNLPEEEVSVYGPMGNLIFEKKSSKSPVNHMKLLEKLQKNKVLKEEKNGKQYLGFEVKIDKKEYYVIATAADVYGYTKLRNLRTVLVITFFISIILLWFQGRIFTGRAFKPISGMVKQVNSINIHNLHQRLDSGDENDELGQLAKTFNDLLYRIEKAFISQRNFIANASHELRTPLTAISGQLEVELLSDRSEKEYKETMSSVLEDMKNLNEIANKLLILAHASSENPKNQFKIIRIDEVLWLAQNDIIKRIPEAKVKIEFGKEMDDDKYFTIFGSEHLTRTAFINLMDNACKYSVDKEVNITVSQSLNHCILEFSDNGIGIKDEDIKHIFQPFYRSWNVMNIKGHGIGLSLVEKIIQIHNASITVKSSDSGTQFRIAFPLAAKVPVQEKETKK